MQLQTWVHARMPRVECPDHGVKQVDVSWAGPGSRFTKFGSSENWVGRLREGQAIRNLLLTPKGGVERYG